MLVSFLGIPQPYGAQARKPVRRYNNRKVNNNYLMLCLDQVIELVPDKAS